MKSTYSCRWIKSEELPYVHGYKLIPTGMLKRLHSLTQSRFFMNVWSAYCNAENRPNEKVGHLMRPEVQTACFQFGLFSAYCNAENRPNWKQAVCTSGRIKWPTFSFRTSK